MCLSLCQHVFEQWLCCYTWPKIVWVFWFITVVVGPTGIFFSQTQSPWQQKIQSQVSIIAATGRRADRQTDRCSPPGSRCWSSPVSSGCNFVLLSELAFWFPEDSSWLTHHWVSGSRNNNSKATSTLLRGASYIRRSVLLLKGEDSNIDLLRSSIYFRAVQIHFECKVSRFLRGWTNLLADLSVNKNNIVQGQDDFGYACCSFVLPV